MAGVKTILTIADSRTINNNTTVYFAAGTGRLREDSTETNRQVVFRVAGIVTGMMCNLPVNSCNGATVVTLRVNAAATVMQITIPASTTGQFFIRSDAFLAIAAGDLLAYEVAVAGNTGSIAWGQISIMYEPQVPTGPNMAVTRLVCSGIGGTISNTTARFFEIAGDTDVSGTSETDKKIRIFDDPVQGTLGNLGVYVSANTRDGDCVVHLRVNGASPVGGPSVTIPAGQTGWFEDNTNTYANSGSDDLNYQAQAAGTTGSVLIQTVAITYTNLGAEFPAISAFPAGSTVNATGITTYTTNGGLSFNGSESTRSPRNRLRLKASGLYDYTFSNSISAGDCSVSVRAGGANTALALAGPVAGATGAGTNTSDIAYLAPRDSLTFQLITPNNTGAVNIRSVAMVLQTLPTIASTQAIGWSVAGIGGRKSRRTFGASVITA